MKYILKIFGRYFVRSNDDSWDEIYDPNFATIFSSKKQAMGWACENTRLSDRMDVIDLESAIKEFEEWRKNGMIRRTTSYLSDLSRCYSGESPEEILQWHLSVASQDLEIKHEHYKTWPKLGSVFECLQDINAYRFQTGEKKLTFLMSVSSSTDYSTFVRELKLVLPFITFREDSPTEKNAIAIDILDYNLSAYGDSFTFYVLDSGEYEIGKYYLAEKFKTLKEAFDYWQSHRPYELSSYTEDEDD